MRSSLFDFLNSAARHRAKETRAKKIEEKGENPYRFRVSIYMGPGRLFWPDRGELEVEGGES